MLAVIAGMTASNGRVSKSFFFARRNAKRLRHFNRIYRRQRNTVNAEVTISMLRSKFRLGKKYRFKKDDETYLCGVVLKILSSIFIALVLTSAGHAQTVSVHFRFEPSEAVGKLTPVPLEASYDCDAPSIPAEIALSYKLSPSWLKLSPFLQAYATARKITVRRGGHVEQSQDDRDFQPRIARTNSREQQIEATDMSLSMTSSFCEYKGFLEFIRADLVISGQIGDFRVHHQEIIKPEGPDGFSLTYNSRNWNSSDGGQFLPLSGHWYYSNRNILGKLSLTRELEAVPFESVEGEGQLLVDMNVWGTIQVTKMGESP